MKKDRIFLGLDQKGQEIAGPAKTHILAFNISESGMRKAMNAISENAFTNANGIIRFYSGDDNNAKKAFMAARRFSREDDFLLLDFRDDCMRLSGKESGRMTNTFNPFAETTGQEAANILLWHMPPENNPNGVFQKKAEKLISALAKTLSDEAARTGKTLTVKVIRDSLDPEKCANLASKNTETSGNLMRVMQEELRYNPEDPDNQDFKDQFGYAKGYFETPLKSLAATYAHMFETGKGEVDMHDCLFNRRIVYVQIPSLAKKPCADYIGKLILGALKNAMSQMLQDLMDGKQCAGDELIVIDDYATIITPDFDKALTQCKGLRLTIALGTPNLDILKHNGGRTADTIIANTGVQMFMKTDVGGKTGEFAKEMFGKILVNEIQQHDMCAVSELALKIERCHLSSQTEDEFTVIMGNNMFSGKIPDIETEKANSAVRPNRFVPLEIDMKKLKERFPD